MIKEEIIRKLQEIVKDLTKKDIRIQLSIPVDSSHGDFSTNVALQTAKEIGKNPLEVAREIVSLWEKGGKVKEVAKIEAVSPGFINITLSKDHVTSYVQDILNAPEKVVGLTKTPKYKNVLVEFAHPNTHKELHIGHMRTLTTGESLARIFETLHSKVFRANYQGDIGPHVAKAIYGVEKMMDEQHLTLKTVGKWQSAQKAHFLGQGYARGSKEYEDPEVKKTIDAMNTSLYKKEKTYWDIYQITRQWSLDYYDEFYKRFYTKFDHLFFEGDVYESGKKIIQENIGKVFIKDKDGSVILPGEKYGLHTRVFITQKGNATYEGKEIGLGFAEYDAFHFNMKIHVVGSEQSGYFQVVFKALELLDPKKFSGRQYHLPMGMVQLVGKKMSSRTGDVLTVDELLDKVKKAAEKEFKEGMLSAKEKKEVLEQVTIGAVKYSILKGGVTHDSVFDIEKSVSLQGNSGPYIQYTFARTQSILKKQKATSFKLSEDYTPKEEEMIILRLLYTFSSVIEKAAEELAPNKIADFLYTLSKEYNLFYQKYRIVNAPSKIKKDFRLALTKAVGIVLKLGLGLLGIQAPEKM